ncbi:protein YIPF1 [Onthophagus taurus]|uniref:protein YIPF1 n=1 Tax=Onthophagus taurus TaxID=166361 RepID=UPI000C201F2C|nr:protein YIPF1 [Onthophagus taurus]
MAGLKEVPTDELLSFHDYPSVHTSGSSETLSAQLNVNDINVSTNSFQQFSSNVGAGDGDKESERKLEDNPNEMSPGKSFWTLDYYQKFFDVDTTDVLDRIKSSVLPNRDTLLKSQIKARPDLYGPFWISVTLVFTIAISGNVANYLQHANEKIHWKYDFHLVSYAATTIFLYITIIPLGLWSLLKWSMKGSSDLESLEETIHPKALELICIYGYSLFIYIPTSILWTIQVSWLQWLLVIIAACLSGSVLLFTLSPSLKVSRHQLFITLGIITFHLLLAAGFMLYFFHVPNSEHNDNHHKVIELVTTNKTEAKA